MSVQRTFTPINGAEIRQMILKDLEEQMAKDSDFSHHLTYPQVKYEVEIKVTCFQRDPQQFSRKVSGAIVQASPETKQPIPVHPTPVVERTVRRSRDIVTPDKDRVAMGMPTLEVTKIPGVGTVETERYQGRGVVIKNDAADRMRDEGIDPRDLVK